MNWIIYTLNLTTQTLLWVQFYKTLLCKNSVSLRFTTEQIQNFMSITHNLVCLLFILMYHKTEWSEIIPFMCIWSQSYYIFDSFNYSGHKDQTTMILHHIGGALSELYLMTLCYDPLNHGGKAVLWGFFYCEISNYPMYYIFHYTHRVSGELNYVDPLWHLVVGLSFWILRGSVGVYYLFIVPVTTNTLWLIIFTFWVLSLYWGVCMVRKYFYKKNLNQHY